MQPYGRGQGAQVHDIELCSTCLAPLPGLCLVPVLRMAASLPPAPQPHCSPCRPPNPPCLPLPTSLLFVVPALLSTRQVGEKVWDQSKTQPRGNRSSSLQMAPMVVYSISQDGNTGEIICGWFHGELNVMLCAQPVHHPLSGVVHLLTQSLHMAMACCLLVGRAAAACPLLMRVCPNKCWPLLRSDN